MCSFVLESGRSLANVYYIGSMALTDSSMLLGTIFSPLHYQRTKDSMLSRQL